MLAFLVSATSPPLSGWVPASKFRPLPFPLCPSLPGLGKEIVGGLASSRQQRGGGGGGERGIFYSGVALVVVCFYLAAYALYHACSPQLLPYRSQPSKQGRCLCRRVLRFSSYRLFPPSLNSSLLTQWHRLSSIGRGAWRNHVDCGLPFVLVSYQRGLYSVHLSLAPLWNLRRGKWLLLAIP